ADCEQHECPRQSRSSCGMAASRKHQRQINTDRPGYDQREEDVLDKQHRETHAHRTPACSNGARGKFKFKRDGAISSSRINRLAYSNWGGFSHKGVSVILFGRLYFPPVSDVERSRLPLKRATR